MTFLKFRQRASAPCSDSLAYVLHKPSRSTYIFGMAGKMYAAQFTPNVGHYLQYPQRYTTAHIQQHTTLLRCRLIDITPQAIEVLQRSYSPICTHTIQKLTHLVNLHLRKHQTI